MKDAPFNAKKPDDSVNISKENPLASFLRLLLGAVAVVTCLYLALGVASDFAVRFVSHQKERELFRFISLKKYVSPPKTPWEGQPELESLLNKVLKNSQNVEPQSVLVTCSKNINASAHPGQHLVLTSSLLETMRSEVGLAFVLAHEIAHMQLQHSLKSYVRGRSWMMAHFLLGLANDSFFDEIESSTLTLNALSFSREQEREADSLAMKMILATYGHLENAEELFERTKNRASLQWTTAFLSTHPSDPDRIERIKMHPNYLNRDPQKKPLPWNVPGPRCK